MIVIAIRLVFFKNQHNRSFEHERENGHMSSTIPAHVYDDSAS
jgi:hypothetical protein